MDRSRTMPTLRFLAFLLICCALPAAAQDTCETISFYNAAGSTVAFQQRLPTARFAVRMTAPHIPRVDTAFIGFGVRKWSGLIKKDTIEVQVLDSNAPTFTQLDKDVFTLMPPAGQQHIADAYYMIELNFQNGAATIVPNRDFYLAYRFKGPTTDSARILFKTPAADTARSVVINANGTLTTATTYVSSQISSTVDLFADVHVCYPYGTPIELASFTARLAEGRAELAWSTASETRNYGFEVHRLAGLSESGRGKIWERIGFVLGYGNSTQMRSYRFTDPDPGAARDSAGGVTYRLRQVDIDGTASYSPVVRVQLDENEPGFSLAQNYPNPCGPGAGAGGTITMIAFRLSEPGHVSLRLYDEQGRLVRTLLDETRGAGAQTISADARDLPPGTYLYILRSGGAVLSRRMTVIR